MKSITDINKIKHLLDLFYQGQSTPEQEATLRAYFLGEVAPELRADAEVFAAMASMAQTDVDVPDGLEDKLMALTTPVAPKPKAFGFKKWVYTAIGAAAVLLAGVLLIRGLSPSHPHTLAPEPPLLANVNVIIAEPLPADTGIVVAPDPVVKPVRKSTPAVTPAPMVAESSTDDNFREVTDPAEAARILDEISTLLAKKLTEGSNAVATMNMAFNQTRDQYNSISKKITQ